jgi:aryl-alcohol dehydrogenase-like predicted oxidoreductase
LYWGVSEWNADQIREAVETAVKLNAPPPVSNQPYYNMLARDIEEEVIPTSRELGLGQVVFSPLAQGVLSGKYKPGQKPPADSRAANDQINMFMSNRGLMSAESLERVQKLTALAREGGISMASLALAWCLRLPEVSSVIIGATKSAQIEDNVRASGIRLSPDLLKKIDDLLMAEPSAVNSTQ